MIKKIINVLAVFLTLSLSACSYSPSLMKEMYNDLPSDFSDEIAESINLTSKQAASLDLYFQELMQWHRKNKLPEYSRNFAWFSSVVNNRQVSERNLLTFLSKMEDAPHFEESSHIIRKIGMLARTLSDGQVLQLSHSFEEQYENGVSEISNNSDFKEKDDEMLAVFDFIGLDLNSTQKQALRSSIDMLHDIRREDLNALRIKNQRLISLLRQRNHPKFVSRFVQSWKSHESLLTKDAYIKDQENDKIVLKAIKALIDSFTPQQQNKFSSFLTSMSITFTELSNE